jgi:hypothetical protein
VITLTALTVEEKAGDMGLHPGSMQNPKITFVAFPLKIETKFA